MIGIVMIVIGVFVSNGRDREMRGSSAQGAEIDSLRCNSSFRESRTVKRNYSQLSGRTSDDPSAPEPRVPEHLANSTYLAHHDFQSKSLKRFFVCILLQKNVSQPIEKVQGLSKFIYSASLCRNRVPRIIPDCKSYRKVRSYFLLCKRVACLV